MSEFVRLTLESWGLEHLAPKFEEHCIDEETFGQLSLDEIREILPQIGLRKKFLAHYQFATSYKPDLESASLTPSSSKPSSSIFSQDDSSTINDSKLDASNSSIISEISTGSEVQTKPKRPIPLSASTPLPVYKKPKGFDLDLNELLNNNSFEGAILRSCYADGGFDRKARSKLVNVIINHCLQTYDRIVNYQFEIISKEIKKVFPNELEETYYIPPLSEGPGQKISKGKLVDCYRNKRKDLHKVGVLDKQKSKICAAEDDPDDVEQEATGELQDALNWLNTSKEPWVMVLENWEKTAKYRLLKLHRDDSPSVVEYYSSYPALKQPRGYELFAIDFKAKFSPEKAAVLYTDWPIFIDKIIPYMKKNIRDAAALELVNVLAANDTTTETRDLLILLLLGPLCPPTNIGGCKGSKNGWKPSIQESTDGFILHVKVAADIRTTLARRREKMERLGLTIQPHIIIVGPTVKDINSYFVSVNDIMYKVNSPLEALDSCFQVIHVLNVNYPKESHQIWMLVQKAVFKINTKFDRNFVSVTTIMSYLNHNH